MVRLAVVLFLIFGFTQLVQAADLVVPQTEPVKLMKPTQPHDDFSNCAFITNDCEVCTVDAGGQPHCSSQGIACVPTKRWCLIEGK